MYHGIYTEVRGQLPGLSCFHHVDPGNQNEVARIGSKCPYSLHGAPAKFGVVFFLLRQDLSMKCWLSLWSLPPEH